jgi:hypothetical protein
MYPVEYSLIQRKGENNDLSLKYIHLVSIVCMYFAVRQIQYRRMQLARHTIPFIIVSFTQDILTSAC